MDKGAKILFCITAFGAAVAAWHNPNVATYVELSRLSPRRWVEDPKKPCTYSQAGIRAWVEEDMWPRFKKDRPDEFTYVPIKFIHIEFPSRVPLGFRDYLISVDKSIVQESSKSEFHLQTQTDLADDRVQVGAPDAPSAVKNAFNRVTAKIASCAAPLSY